MVWKMLLSLFLASGNHSNEATVKTPPYCPSNQNFYDISNFSLEELVVLDHIDRLLHNYLHWKIKKLIGIAYGRGLDYRTLNRGFIFMHGQTFPKYRRWIRLQAAKQLLFNDYMDVERVVMILGYTNRAILERDFKNLLHITLSDFQAALLTDI